MIRQYGLIALAVLAVLAGAAIPWPLGDDTRSALNFQMRSTLGLSMAVRGELQFHALPFARITMSDVSIADAHGLNVHAQNMNASVDLFALMLGTFRISTLSIDNSAITFNLDQEYQAEALAASAPADMSSALGKLMITDSAVHIISSAQDIDTELAHVNLRIDWPRLSSPAALEGRVKWQGKDLNFAAWLGNPLALMRRDTTPLSFKLISDAAQLKSTGSLHAGPHIQYEGHTDARFISMHDLAYLAGATIPPSLTADITSLSAATLITPHTVLLSDVRADYDRHKIEGSISIQKTDHTRPLVSATLAADEINIALQQTQEPTPAQTPASVESWSPTHFGSIYDIIGADIDMRISIGRLHLDNLLIRDAGISILLNSGRLDMALAEARLHRGSVRGRFALSPVPDGYAASLSSNWHNVETSSLMADLLKTSNISGPSDGSLELSTQGDSWAHSIDHLQGKMSATISNGALDGFDIEQALRRLDRKPLMAMTDLRTGRTGFDLITLNAHMTNGLASVDESSLRGPSVQFDISGQMDAPHKAVDVKILARQTNTQNTEGRQLTFTIKGPWLNPKMNLDTKALLNRL
jgi:AsmA protein